MFGRSVLNLLGVAAVLGSLVALTLPMGLTAVDRAGTPIPCGNGMAPGYETAAKQDQLNLDQHTLAGPAFATSDYVDQCAGLIRDRRTIAFAVGGSGAALLLVVFATPFAVNAVRSRRRRQGQNPGAPEPVGYQPYQPGVGAQWGADQVGSGVTQPILEKSVGKQVGRHNYAAAAAAALRGDGLRDAGGTGRGERQFYAVAGNR